MRACVCTIWFLLGILSCASGQSPTSTTTWSNYNEAQKHLLLASTAIFINSGNNNLDEDSVMAMARRFYGFGFLMPFNEGLINQTPSPGIRLVDASRTAEAELELQAYTGEKRLQLLIALGTWYLHQPGTQKRDLDQAYRHIQEAVQISGAPEYKTFSQECRFLLGKWHYQNGEPEEGKALLTQLASRGQEGNGVWLARSCQRLGEVLADADTMKRFYLQKARTIYQGLQQKEKEIELLLQLAVHYLRQDDYEEMDKALADVLQLQKATGFRHSLFVQHLMSTGLIMQTRYMEALQIAQAALANQKWSGITQLSSSFNRLVGKAYVFFAKYEEALPWLYKSIENRTKETHVFWYSSFLFTASILSRMDRQEEAIALMDSINREHLPITPFEKLMFAQIKGECYHLWNKPDMADRYYMEFLNLSNMYPGVDPMGGIESTFGEIAYFYIARGDISKTQLFVKKFLAYLERENMPVYVLVTKYTLLYKLDSLSGNYKSALANYMTYKFYEDSLVHQEQGAQLEELNVKYAAEKKDKDIQLLTERGKVQQAALKQNTLTRNITLGGAGLLVVILVLLYQQYRLKQRSAQVVEKKNNALTHLVQEKEWLLKEVHHRVKNNLQTVVSLLELQAENLNNEALSAIQLSQNRIYTISLIHQKLYKGENVASINIKEYLFELSQHLREVYGVDRKVDFDINIAPLDLDVSQAIPIGLIVNEAVTNSIKHGFEKAVRNLKISILLHQHAHDQVELKIADNGKGLPQAFDDTKVGGLGFKLIRALVDDLEGKISITSEKGTSLMIQFSKRASLDVNPGPSRQLQAQTT